MERSNNSSKSINPAFPPIGFLLIDICAMRHILILLDIFRLHLKKTFCKAIFYCILFHFCVCFRATLFSDILVLQLLNLCFFFFPVLCAFLVSWLAPYGPVLFFFQLINKATNIGNMHSSVLDF